MEYILRFKKWERSRDKLIERKNKQKEEESQGEGKKEADKKVDKKASLNVKQEKRQVKIVEMERK